MPDLGAITLAVLLLLGNAFFVGAEFALISARRTQIEPRAASGSRAARTTLRAMEQVSLMMAGAQLGITACSLGLGALGEPAVAHLLEGPLHTLGVPDAFLHPIAFAIALAIVVYLHMVIGEMVPKNIALAGPERSALILGPALFAIVSILRPLILLLNEIANIVLRLLRVQPREEVASTFTRDEVAAFVGQSKREGLLDDYEHALLTGALGFTDRTVSAVTLPIAEVITVPQEATPAEVEQLCATTGYSRFPIRDGDGDVTGYVHTKDLLDLDPHEKDHPLSSRTIRPLPSLTERQPLHAALPLMQNRGAHLARVTDAQTGRLLGIATLEDILEILVGEVHDSTQRAR